MRMKSRKLLRVVPKKGSAIMWDSLDERKRVNPASLHAGEPVKCKSVRKIALNAWFLEAPEKAAERVRLRVDRERH